MATYDTTYITGVASGDPGDGRDPRIEKLISLFFSRKFLVQLFGIIGATGILQLSDSQAATYIQAILFVGGFALIAFNIAVEDGLRGMREADEMGKENK